jgi:hypothetical protein
MHYVNSKYTLMYLQAMEQVHNPAYKMAASATAIPDSVISVRVKQDSMMSWR